VRKPTPPPKVPALVRRGVAAAAVGIGVGGAACGGSVEVTPKATDASDPADTNGADGPSRAGDAGSRSDASLGDDSGIAVLTEDAAAAEDSAIKDAGTDAPRILPPLPPPLPPK
jgi:hypothetical protein